MTTSTSGSRRSAPSGAPDPNGMRYITVGTGGSSHHSVGTVKAGSEVRNVSTFGVLRLVLHPASYDWEFYPIAGFSFTDSGTQAIVGANSPPSATVALTPGDRRHERRADGHGHQVRSGERSGQPDLGVARQRRPTKRTFTSGARSRTRSTCPGRQRRHGRHDRVTVTPSDAAHAGTPVSASQTITRDQPGAGVHDRPDRPDPGRGRHGLARRERDRPRRQRPDLQRHRPARGRHHRSWHRRHQRPARLDRRPAPTTSA